MELCSSGYSKDEWGIIYKLFESPTEGDFYHYTSLKNSINMLTLHKPEKGALNQNPYLELWASHFLFSNDSAEFKDGLEILKRKLEFIAKDKENYSPKVRSKCEDMLIKLSKESDIFVNLFPNHYILSFCSDGNLLGQWKYYGKNCGIAIGYDLSNCVLDGFRTYEAGWGKRPVYKIQYKNSDKEKILNKIFSTLKRRNISPGEDELYITECAILKAIAAVSFMKANCYHEERESRLLFAPIYNSDKDTPEEAFPKLMKLVSYRERDGKLIPYLKIALRHTDSNKYPVKSLTVGPGQNQNLIYNALIMLVQSNFPSPNPIIQELPDEDNCKVINVNGIKVRRSLIPFRE